MDVRESTMRNRIPGELLIHKLVADHGARPQRSGVARFFGVPPIHSEDWPWFQGAIGERTVAQTLSTLPAGWHVFHSIPIGTDDADIDHVVVGPPGVFSINSKHHAGKAIWVGDGTCLVNGHKEHYIRNSEHEATRLTTMIRSRFPWAPAVRPVLAFVNAKSIMVKTAPRDVHIDGGRTIVRWLRKQREVFNPETVDQIATFLDNPQTWRAIEPVDRDELTRRFNEISSDRSRALSIQTAWKFLGVVVLIVVGIWMLTTLF